MWKRIFSIEYESEQGVEYGLIVSEMERIGRRLGQNIKDQQADFVWAGERGEGLFGVILESRGLVGKAWFQGVSEDARWIPDPGHVELVREALGRLFAAERIETTCPVTVSSPDGRTPPA